MLGSLIIFLINVFKYIFLVTKAIHSNYETTVK